MILCLVRSSHYNGENISWANLKSQNAKSVEASKLNQWVISLPLIDQYWDLEDVSPSDHLVWWYSRLLHWVIYQYEDWIHERNKECAMVHQADQPFSSLRWLNTLSLFWNSKDLYKTIHFWFLIPNRNIQASWKMKFLRPRKVYTSPLNLNSLVWFFSSSLISNLIPISVEPVLEMGLGDDTIVVTREWLQRLKLKM